MVVSTALVPFSLEFPESCGPSRQAGQLETDTACPFTSEWELSRLTQSLQENIPLWSDQHSVLRFNKTMACVKRWIYIKEKYWNISEAHKLHPVFSSWNCD